MISSETIRQVFLVDVFVHQCNPQSDQHSDASLNCFLGGLAVVFVASPTELKHHGLRVVEIELLRHLLQGSGCLLDRAIDRERTPCFPITSPR